MNVFVTTISGMIGFLAQSFKLSAVFPAFVFAFLNEILILPALPQKGIIVEVTSLDLLGKSIVAIVVGLVVGYTLNILNIPLVRFFEGYSLRNTCFGQLLTQIQRAKLSRLEEEINRLKDQHKALEQEKTRYSLDDTRRQAIYERQQKLDFDIRIDQQRRVVYFPTKPAELLPMSLGNTIAVFEDYPWTRYCIDAVVLWPRLLPTLTKENYAVYVEREKAGLDFALNMCALLIFFGLETAYTGLLLAHDWIAWSIGAGLVLLVAWAFYSASITSAFNWGVTVRVAFDLYRYRLLSALYGRPPIDFSDERDLWEALSHFAREGVPRKEQEEKEISRILHYCRIREELRKPSDLSGHRTTSKPQD